MNNLIILFLIIAVAGFVFIAPTLEMVEAVNQSENPATAERKHNTHKKHTNAKVCGLQLC